MFVLLGFLLVCLYIVLELAFPQLTFVPVADLGIAIAAAGVLGLSLEQRR